jgi:hypothetical protein
VSITTTRTALAIVAAAGIMSGLAALTPQHAERTVASQPNDAHATRQPGGPAATETPNGRPPLSTQAHRLLKGAPGAEVRVGPSGESLEEDGDEITESTNGYSTKQLANRGGPVQTSPRIYLVFWGPNWFKGGDPYGVANRLNYFYSGLGGSSINTVLKQYGSAYGSYTNPAGQYRGWLQDTTAVPARPTSDEMRRAALRAAARVNDFGYNAQYVIATPWGVVDQYSAGTTTGSRACAWHYWTSAGSSWITYTSLPYTPYLDASGFGCGGYKVNSAGRLDGVTINALHEYAETVTDPGVNAWKDADGSENADKCSWVNLRNYTLTNGYSFPVQPTWSNRWRSTYGYGCYYS